MNNKVQHQSLEIVNDDSDLALARIAVSGVFDSASIRDFVVTRAGRQFKIVVTSKYHVPQLCLKELESKGYSVQTIRGSEQGLEITIGGNSK